MRNKTAHRVTVTLFALLVLALAPYAVQAKTVTLCTLDILADDSAHIYINGTLVTKMKCAPCLERAYHYEMPLGLFHNGKNVLALWVYDTESGWLAVSYVLAVHFDDGTMLEIVSDASNTTCWPAGFHRPENLNLPGEGWKNHIYDDSKWKPAMIRKKKGADTPWGNVLNKAGKKVPWVAKDRYGAIEKYEVHIFRDYFEVSGLPEPTATPAPTATAAPTATVAPSATPVPAATLTSVPTAPPTHTYTWTPVPPTPTAIFTRPPSHTFPPTDTYTLTYTPIPTPTPWTEVTENIEVHGRMLSRYFRFEGQQDFLGKRMATTITNFAKLEFLGRGKDGKSFQAKVTLENGRSMAFDEFARLSWPDGETHTNLLIPLDNNKDNQGLLSLALAGEQGEDAIYLFNNFIVVPFKYLSSLEVIKQSDAFKDRRNICTMELTLKGKQSETETERNGESESDGGKTIKFKAPGLPPGAPH